MAAELVGGAFLSSFLNVLFDRLSSPEVVNWILGNNNLIDDNLLQRLETSLCVVQAILNDADQKQINDPSVKKWLTNLEDAVYVADDLLDEVSTKSATQQKDQGTNFLSHFVAKIEGIIDRLESVVKFKDALGLKEVAEDNMSWRVPSTSLVEKSDIYGRDEDKEKIVELLLDDTFDICEIPVISIVGIGGIGKTTLAQLVYNDDRVKGKFESRAWVCVAEKFDVVSVTKTIIEAITCSPCSMNSFDLLQTNLMERLKDKMFLVVLDDIWNDRPEMWRNLLKPFRLGSKGSKVLITTRNEKVAYVNPSIPPYKLSLLSDEDCWSVFLKHSFLSNKPREYATLEQIGRRIVKKCKGLPLAVETLGGLLRAKCNRRDWDDVLKSEIWELSEDESRIIPALRISYHYLPSHLKRCFVYCSLYPKGYEFDKDELILLWMAEGFLRPSGTKILEEIGCLYFNELVARSFFQPSMTTTRDPCFVMHDLMHDLAIFCAGEFYFRVEELGSATKIDSKTRHLSYNVQGNYPISKLLASFGGVKHMRTFVDTNLKQCVDFKIETDKFNTENLLSLLLSQLKFLRVLSLKSFPLDSLPGYMGELIHLRYFDLSNTCIVTLPESLGNLYNLQTLKLRNCTSLKMLPSSMQDLVNLRHLDIRGTPLEEMPKGMSKLKHLQFLSDYIVGKHEENKIWELGALVDLHGGLSISNLENFINGNEALEAKLTDKKHINNLYLSWSSNNNIADSLTERDILDKLQPHQNLEQLSTDGYRGTIFPDWLGRSSYNNMTHLKLNGCENCCMLPSLGQLPSLKHLSISGFCRLVSIGAEFYKGDETCQETPFQSLETLLFDRLECWQEWHSFEFSNAFPQLKELTLRFCPKLVGDLPSHLPALEKLTIHYGCEKLACSLPMAPAMLELSVESTDGLIRMRELPVSLRSLRLTGSQLVESMFEAMTCSQLTSLRSLSISYCDSAISFPGDCLSASLQSVEIYYCKKLDFPTQQQQHGSLLELTVCSSCDSLTSFSLNAFPNLRNLVFINCENMKSLVVSQSHDSHGCSSNFESLSTLQLQSLSISDCPQLDSLPEGALLPRLRKLRIGSCEKLIMSCLSSMDLSSYSLTDISIEDASESVKSIPKEASLPTSLEFLSLNRFPGLETLNCDGLSHLTSLQYLHIGYCEKLENLTGEKLPASITHLSIAHSPLLGERCWVKDPKIWPIISHIRHVHVGDRWIS